MNYLPYSILFRGNTYYAADKSVIQVIADCSNRLSRTKRVRGIIDLYPGVFPVLGTFDA